MKSYWQCVLASGVTIPVAKPGLSSFDDRAPSMRRIEQRLPENVIRKTSAKYRKAFQRLTGKKIEFRNVVVKSG
jgi:hypothetical protein